MLGTSLPEYVFIRSVITILRLVAPASILYLVASAVQPGHFPQSWLAPVAVLEALFFLVVYLPRKRAMQKPAVHPLLDKAQRRELFERCASCLSDATYPAGWFSTPNFRRGNVRQWLLWALFSCNSPGEGRPEWGDEVDEYLAMTEKVLGHTLDEGHNAASEGMRLTLDPVVMVHRPLIWYLIVGSIDMYTAMRLAYLGFAHYDTSRWFKAFPPRLFTVFSRALPVPEFSYWYRPHRSATKLPVVFFHGIGIGLFPYIPFFSDMITRDPDVGILAIEILSVSMHMTAPPPAREAILAALTTVLATHALGRFVLAAHSYGTVLAAHVLRAPLRARVAGALLVDPIPLLLHLPDVARNFVYRAPHAANEWAMWYFASRDADIARALSRHFFWAENVLWREELPARAAVALCGRDQIVLAEEVRKYVTGGAPVMPRWVDGDLEVLFYPELDHAMAFDTTKRRALLLDSLDRLVTDDVLLT